MLSSIWKRSLRSLAMQKAPLLMSPRELQELLASSKAASIKVLDATWFMPNIPRRPKAEFVLRHLPSAQYWDLDDVAAPSPLNLKHMLPTSTQFQHACNQYGIAGDDHVVIYDTHGVFSSPRALFTFRAFGHELSSVLNGGLEAWQAEGYPLVTNEDSMPFAVNRDYPEPTLDQDLVKDYEQIVSNSMLDPSSMQLVLDARSKRRWTGEDSEPRPNIPSGHIPHSISLPFTTLLKQYHSTVEPTKTYTAMPEPTELEANFRSQLGNIRFEDVLQGKQGVINSCGSGMTAAILWLAFQVLGVKTSIYDESWTGYALRPTSRVDKGNI